MLVFVGISYIVARYVMPVVAGALADLVTISVVALVTLVGMAIMVSPFLKGFGKPMGKAYSKAFLGAWNGAGWLIKATFKGFGWLITRIPALYGVLYGAARSFGLSSAVSTVLAIVFTIL